VRPNIDAAHCKQSDFERFLANIRQVRQLSGFPVAILLDLSGPKIRLGQLVVDPLEVEVGMELTLVRGERVRKPNQLCSNYTHLVDEVAIGNEIMLADGTVSLVVISRSRDELLCRATTAGTLHSRQGINLPGGTLSVAAMRLEDVENAIWDARNEIDFIGLGFVRSPDDTKSLKHLLASHDSQALVIAKIETREALERLEGPVEKWSFSFIF